ncbi:MAG: V-type ATP synthase subunit F [bacterium]|nr:V-type ATP synthase subunit F [bacterium]
MSDTAIAGNLSEILAFKAAGLNIYSLDELSREKKINDLIRNILEQGHKIVFVTEEYYEEFARIYEEMKTVRKERLPVLMPVLNGIESRDIGRRQLKTLVEKAIGVDIFKEK